MAKKPQGLDRLKRQIGALPALQRRETGVALETGAADLAGKVAAAWHDPELGKHTSHQKGAPRTRNGEAGAIKADAGLSYFVHTDKSSDDGGIHNPIWEEWGTAPHSTAQGASLKTGKRQGDGPHHPGARARPAFWPTVRANRKALKAKVTRASSKAAKAAAATR